jgi:hypothetical protein
MANECLKRKYPVILAAMVFAGLFVTGICLAADDTDTDTSNESSIEIPKRVQEAIVDVNELSKAEEKKLEAVKRQRYLNNFHDEPAGSLLSKEDVNRIEQQRKEREQAILAKAQAQEEQTKDFAESRSAESRPNLSSVSYAEGTVTGIVFCTNKGAALMLGDVIREGDVVRGVTVVRITPDYVEFEKQGNKWKQEVGQSPPAGVWEKPRTQQQINAEKKQDAGRKK